MRIAIVSDFFFPALGGAEVHIYSVSAMLSQLGHHVVIITHAVEGYVGEKLLSSGVKVRLLCDCSLLFGITQKKKRSFICHSCPFTTTRPFPLPFHLFQCCEGFCWTKRFNLFMAMPPFLCLRTRPFCMLLFWGFPRASLTTRCLAFRTHPPF